MTTTTLARGRGRISHSVRAALTAAATVAGARSRPVAAHLSEHFYTIAGFGFLSGAAYVHSLFTGLIVTGASFLVFEWKVSD